MPSLRPLAAAALALAVCCPGVGAQALQWRGVAHTPAAAGLPSRAALVESEDGHRLRVYLDADANITARFTLPAGLRALAADGCPTLKVDDFETEALHTPAQRCRVDGATAILRIAPVREGAVDSATVLALLNGEALRVIYRLGDGAGYDDVSFTLRRSKSVLLDSLPDGTLIVGD